MKTEKWYTKVNAMFDENASRVRFDNGTCGAYFAIDGNVGYYLPAQVIMTADARNGARGVIEKNFKLAENGTLATSIVRGRDNKNRRIVKMTSSDGATVYVQEKFIRQFPKNALYYVTSFSAPVFVALENYPRLDPVAIVMPVLVDYLPGLEFVPDAV